ncbi:MAG: nickel pincer cofactor biosynthesis protein LarB [Pirellulales bacterium]|nr:nickel pincer cofactor biosynthesis protein LarB [Pirellulales bacterium]
MNHAELEFLVRQVVAGDLTVEALVAALRPLAVTADVGVAQVDLDRERRCGFPEVVYGQGKSVEALERIFKALLSQGTDVFATRISLDQFEQLTVNFPSGIYNPVGRTFRIPVRGKTRHVADAVGRVAVVTAGTSDLPVAEEARETLLWMGCDVAFVQDVGVAGPHRLPAKLAELREADAIVVVAGMEGALPSVVGGYVACPVIGVPTSVGYGANFAGLSALLSMLNSCAANVTVVNIDAGFKGGYVAGLIATNAARRRTET